MLLVNISLDGLLGRHTVLPLATTTLDLPQIETKKERVCMRVRREIGIPIQSSLREDPRGVDGSPHSLLIVRVRDVVNVAEGVLVGGAARAEDPNLGGLRT
jgi:Arc/MetJ family transcription regulator